jgi:NADPH-dependent 2,4-dienoyl-CoA reductase/sulfur reductase-like enzyme
MESVKYLLIGGGLASNRAAKTLRQKDPEGSICIVGEEAHIPYNRPPLSKEYLRKENSREKLFYDQKEYYEEKSIELKLGCHATELNLTNRTVNFEGGDGIEFEKAFIATGGRPVKLNLPGGDLDGIYYLRNLDDTEAISAEAQSGKSAMIVGGGFIGLEVAASLAQMGLEVHVIESESRIWSRFTDESLSKFFMDYCKEKGISFHTGDVISEFKGDMKVSSVVTGLGEELKCDFAVIAIGILPNTELAKEAGLDVDNGIVVNRFLQTSHPDVYAGGDCANYPDPIFNKRRRVEHWGHAGYCGNLAAQNMVGSQIEYDHLTTVWSDIFDLKLLFGGNEHECDRVLLRGSMEEKAFVAFYLKGNITRAYFSVNSDMKLLRYYQRLIKENVDLENREAQLQDIEFDLKDFFSD